MQSILATGATLQKRKEYIEKQLDKLKISKFDRFYLKADRSIKIEQIRILRQQLQQKTIKGKFRAGIILESEKATIEAQNALLKILEEPPLFCYLFLCAPNPAYLLATIISRCKLIKLSHTQKLNKKTEKEMRNIFQYLTSDASEEFASVALKPAFELAEKLGKDRQTADQFLQNALLYTRQQYLSTETSSETSDVSRSGSLDVEKTLGVKNLTRIAQKILLSRRLIGANVNPRQVLENLFLDL